MPGSAIPEAPLRGVALFCLGLALLVGMTGIVKLLARTYPLEQIIWARYFFHCLLMLAAFPHRIPTFLVSRRKRLQVGRGVVMLLGTLFSFSALRFMRLADITAVGFTTPLIATALSVVMLGERVGRWRWGAVLVGFLGVLIVVRPGAGVFDWWVLLPIAMACCYALYGIMTRLVREAADPLNALFYTALVGALVTTPLLWFSWLQPAGLLDWLVLASLGLLGGTGHFLMIQAYRRAPVSIIAPFGYTELIWAASIGYIAFGELPDFWTWIGAGVIAASGLFVLYRERVVGVRPAPVQPAS